MTINIENILHIQCDSIIKKEKKLFKMLISKIYFEIEEIDIFSPKINFTKSR